MPKTILFVHGRNYKAPKSRWESLWKEAVASGIRRDHPRKVAEFNKASKEYVYYGDLTNTFLVQRNRRPVPDDWEDLQKSLARLKRYRANEFNAVSYRQLPLYRGMGESLMVKLGTVASSLGMHKGLTERIAPDIREYWNEDSELGTHARHRFMTILRTALDRGDKVCVISHSLGAMIAYDCFWKLSRSMEYREPYGDARIDFWITLGSPLADIHVKKKLKGYHATGPRKYPSNVRRWLNVWAVDDFVARQGLARSHFKGMLQHGLVEWIKDKRIYNLTIRRGESSPHSSLGYLIHPTVSAAIARWL